RACNSCRTRKIKCDRGTPSCQPCQTHKRQCIYSREAGKPRPSAAAISALKTKIECLESTLIQIKEADETTRNSLLKEITIDDGSVRTLGNDASRGPCENKETRNHIEDDEPFTISHLRNDDPEQFESVSSDDDLDASPFVSADAQGRVGVFGPTSGLHNSPDTSRMHRQPAREVRNLLIANAVLERQKEYELRERGHFDGISPDLAIHLLHLHWNRQHHSFLLTYRPAFTRDLMSGGRYYSRFLLNAIFASGSKFSDRVELRDDESLPQTAGSRFLRRCQELLYRDSLLDSASIPTIVGLLHLGSAYIARGEMSKSWIHTGLAIRMAFDLGLHLDIQIPDLDPEEIEIRRRAFWAAFITDKLQCLYLGRPMAIQIRDSHVSTELLDTMEELESWSPYVDTQGSSYPLPSISPIPTFSISAFQHFCLLSQLMARIINCFYVVGARPSNPQLHLQELDHALSDWYAKLPECLKFEPWYSDGAMASKRVTPNVMVLHSTYHSLVILLHRPFISNSHLRSTSPPASSWRACSTAAASTTGIINKWREWYALYKAPYLLGYCAYVACTIHVRDAVLQQGGQRHAMLLSTLSMLNEMSSINPALMRSEQLIRNLMHVNNVK
ncbi:nitrogen assimilation transcription factor nirA, partial [Talaromyces proteolyticus]